MGESPLHIGRNGRRAVQGEPDIEAYLGREGHSVRDEPYQNPRESQSPKYSQAPNSVELGLHSGGGGAMPGSYTTCPLSNSERDQL